MNRADVIMFEAKQTLKVPLLFRWLVDMLTTILWKTTFGEPLKTTMRKQTVSLQLF